MNVGRLTLLLWALGTTVAAQQTPAGWVPPLPTCALGAWCTAPIELRETDEAQPTVTSETPDVELIDVRRQDSPADVGVQRWAVRFLPLASGSVALPRVTFAVGPRGDRVVSAPSASVTVTDEPLEADAALRAPIPIVRTSVSSRELLLLGVALAAAVAGSSRAYAGFAGWRLRRARAASFTRALRSLDRLEATFGSETDDGAMMASLLDVLRSLLDQELGLRAAAMSSSELVCAIEGRADADTLRRLCERVDPVKYGARSVARAELAEVVSQAKAFVLDVKRRSTVHRHGEAR